jgi:hypothetical protein
MSRLPEAGNIPYPKSSGRAFAGKTLERALEPRRVKGVLSESKGKPGEEENTGPNGGKRTLSGPDGTSGKCLLFENLKTKVQRETKSLTETTLMRFPNFIEHGSVTKGTEEEIRLEDNGNPKIYQTSSMRNARSASLAKNQNLEWRDLVRTENTVGASCGSI